MVSRILKDVEISLNTDFFSLGNWRRMARKLVFSGQIDQLFAYQYGDLEYLTLRFEHQTIRGDYQGATVINYTDESVPFTRVTEHKHFLNPDCENSIVTHEFPDRWDRNKTPYYPVVSDQNKAVYALYQEELKSHPDILIGGRLGNFKYYNMDQTIECALKDATNEQCLA